MLQTVNEQSQQSLGSVITRGVAAPVDEADQRNKREQKDTRYSRHISSKASFGAQPNSYLLQQHQNVLQHRAGRYEPSG